MSGSGGTEVPEEQLPIDGGSGATDQVQDAVPTDSSRPPANLKTPLNLKFEALAVHRRAALGLLPGVQDPEYNHEMTFSQYKSSRQYRFLTSDNCCVSLSGGYRLCRANRYLQDHSPCFWEIDFKAAETNESHIRIGIATIKADMEAPVGFDAEGYCVRDRGGAFHCARRRDSPAFGVGDTIGFGFRDRELSLWINGVCHGVIFDSIDGEKKWMPAVSVYRDAQVVGRFRRPFRFDPGNEWREAGDLKQEEPVGLFTSKELVIWMRGSLDAGDRHKQAIEAMDAALVPPHLMPI
jgi:hypothetical protein